jgi:hypothetical protein
MADTSDRQPTKLFISVGSHESPAYHDNINSFTEALVRINDSSLNLQTVTLDNETHFSQGARAYVTGLRSVFA